MDKKEITLKLNELGKKITVLKKEPEKNVTEIQKIKIIMWEESYNLLTLKTKNDDYFSALNTFFIVESKKEKQSRFDKFDAEKIDFVKYLNAQLEYAKIADFNEAIDKKNNEIITDEDGKKKKMSRVYLDNEDEEGNPINVLKAQNTASKMEENESITIQYTIFIGQIINFQENLTGRSNTNSRVEWYKKIFAERLTHVIKNNSDINKDDFDILKDSEKEIFKNINNDFLNFFMLLRCENIENIFETRLKTEMEFFGKGKNEQLELPFSAKVYIKHFETEGKIVKDNAVSQYRKDLNELLKQVIKI